MKYTLQIILETTVDVKSEDEARADAVIWHARLNAAVNGNKSYEAANAIGTAILKVIPSH